ncbi:MAG: prohead protease, partial [Deltaproteobacteria bacterium]|nr:prohead protease [Deltaproteobacteria bacterium]
DRAVHHLARSNGLKNSQIVALLEELNIEGLLYIMAVARKNYIKKAVSLYVTTLRQIEGELTGQDLVNLGYKPGPQFKKILVTLRNGRLDGLANDRDEELALLKNTFPL